ncbi:CBS domain-containing protein [Halobacteriovorax sp. GB3]|uniref:CBS domain-containing protein n=1 Tax=Halobacteriovorax sp. GB3 TaxID=2719615 RepID=UPI00235F77AF|nr:CBS domain-containing protein [Halobacteriovorax sp. GB3]MDD0853455.1 CBS domain-containing protein [Halobacteriovorax sp. GB3]
MFYLLIKNQLSKHKFSYLDALDPSSRLEKTLAHGQEKKERRKSDNFNLYAINLMSTPAHCVQKETPLPEVKKLMREKEIRHIPVLDSAQLVGLISDRDLLKLDSSGTFSFLKANEIMSDLLIATDEESSLEELACVLATEKVSCLPVIDQEKKVVGIISYIDLLSALKKYRLIP